MTQLIGTQLGTLLSVVTATLDSEGLLIDANAGFLRLINREQWQVNTEFADVYFIQPSFAKLINIPPGDDGEIYQGLLTIGEYTGKSRSLDARIWRAGNQLRVLAEYDIASLEKLNDTVLQLNHEYAKAQFEITQMNLKLKQREAELEATNLRLITMQKQLVEAEKMASLGVMVAGVAHEINTPLGVSLGNATLLEQQSQVLAQRFADRSMTQSDLNDFLNKASLEMQLIRRNLERIGHLTESFHQLAVNDQASTQSCFNLKCCIDDVVTSLYQTLCAQHVVVLNHCDETVIIESYLDDWASIFTNLISNSLQHGFKDRQKGAIEIRVASHAENLVIDYSDDGIGLSAEIQPHIFDPFFTTDSQHGMGLGMHLVYNIITQKLNGHISCGNLPEQGAIFHIEIPL